MKVEFATMLDTVGHPPQVEIKLVDLHFGVLLSFQFNHHGKTKRNSFAYEAAAVERDGQEYWQVSFNDTLDEDFTITIYPETEEEKYLFSWCYQCNSFMDSEGDVEYVLFIQHRSINKGKPSSTFSNWSEK